MRTIPLKRREWIYVWSFSLLSCWQKFSQERVVLSDLDHLVHIQDFIALAFMADFLIDFARPFLCPKTDYCGIFSFALGG